MHASISDLTTYSRDATGDVPRPSIGSSTTVVDGFVYLFGGKATSSRKNFSADIYAFDLTLSKWEKIVPNSPEHLTPPPRYFHSADHWNGNLVIFGGIGSSSSPAVPGEAQAVLHDIRFFNLAERRWLEPSDSAPVEPPEYAADKPESAPADNALAPRPRFAHLSAISSSKLFILGGQDMVNEWLDDIHVYDLDTKQWIAHVSYPRNCGTYRSAVVAPELVVRDPLAEGVPTTRPKSIFEGVNGLSRSAPTPDTSSVMAPHPLHANSDQLVHMSYSTEPSPEYPAHLYIYSNWNFVDVRRELETIDPTPLTPNIVNRSASMTAHSTTQPPGLRFPTAHILGTYLIIGGTYLAQSYQSYSIWALDLQSMQWTRIDPGTALTSGSWSRGVLWNSTNRFVVFGNRAGNLVEDYNRRVVNWEHVAYVELESLGIYQPPVPKLETATIGGAGVLGPGRLLGLDALDAEIFADFEVLCEDGRRLKCSRVLLEERWPWFRENRKKYMDAARRIIATQHPRSELELDSESAIPPYLTELQLDLAGLPLDERPDPRLTPRLLRLSEPFPITKALLQYFYTYDLMTPLQHAPLVLSALLLLSSIYDIPHLGELVRHAMHRTLGPMTSVGVYDVTTLCDCQNLNIRALRIVMSSNKRSNRSNNRPGTGGSGRSGGRSGGGGGSGRDHHGGGGAGGGDGGSGHSGFDRSTNGRDPSMYSGHSSSTDANSRRGGMGISMSIAANSASSVSVTRSVEDELPPADKSDAESPTSPTSPSSNASPNHKRFASVDLASFPAVPPTLPPQAPAPHPEVKMDAVSPLSQLISNAAASSSSPRTREAPRKPSIDTMLPPNPTPITHEQYSPGSALSPTTHDPVRTTQPFASNSSVMPLSMSLGNSGFQAALGALGVPQSLPSPSEELGAPPLSILGMTSPPASSSPVEGPMSESELSAGSGNESSGTDRPSGSGGLLGALRRGRSERRYRPAASPIPEELSSSLTKSTGRRLVAGDSGRDGSRTPTLKETITPAIDVRPPSQVDDDSSFLRMSEESEAPWTRPPPQIPAQIAAAVAAAASSSPRPSQEHTRMGFGRQRQSATAGSLPLPASAPQSTTHSPALTPPLSSEDSSLASAPTPPPKELDPYNNPYLAPVVSSGVPGIGLSFPKVPRRKRSELLPSQQGAAKAAPPTSFNLRRPSTSDNQSADVSSGRRRSLSDAGPSRRFGHSTGEETTSSSSIDTSPDSGSRKGSAGSFSTTDHTPIPSSSRNNKLRKNLEKQQNDALAEIVIREANRLQHYEDPTDIVIRQANELEQMRARRRNSQDIFISAALSDRPGRSGRRRDPSPSQAQISSTSSDEHGGAASSSEAVGRKAAPSAWQRLFASSTNHAPTSSPAPTSDSGRQTPVGSAFSRRGLFSSSTNSRPSTNNNALSSFTGA